METLNGPSLLQILLSFLQGWPALFLLLCAGLWLSIRSRFVQLLHFPHAMKQCFGALFTSRSRKSGELSPYQAFTTALAATVGTGNISGVAGALAAGGPGAIFWMWISALLGMATKYSEVLLSLRFRERSRRGEWLGGPMYYIQNGLGPRWLWLGQIFALFGLLASFGIGNLAQMNSIADSSCYAAALFFSFPDQRPLRLLLGILTAAVLLLIASGGLKRTGEVTALLVPGMSLLYIGACLAVILSHSSCLLPALKQIVVAAFSPQAILGGGAGISFSAAMKNGLSRGIFSNEAGLGSAPIAHAAAAQPVPVRQGFYGIFEVFADTLVICTLTAVTVLCSGIAIPYGGSAGSPLITQAFATVFPPRLAAVLMTVALCLFALSSMISWGFYGQRCCTFLFGERAGQVYSRIFPLAALWGALGGMDRLWSLAELLNAMMTVPNLVALIALSGVVARETHQYFSRQR